MKLTSQHDFVPTPPNNIRCVGCGYTANDDRADHNERRFSVTINFTSKNPLIMEGLEEELNDHLADFTFIHNVAITTKEET